MKNIFYILLLLPTIIFAQYQGNANQKITLGEQTTADGLVWRGRLADTANLLTNKLDTSVYIVLDTGTRAMWYYRVSTTPKWTRLVDSLNNLQGQLSLTTKVTGVLPVANGGTNRITMPAGYILHGDGTSVDTAIGLFWNRTSNRLGIGTNSPTGSLNIYDNSSAPVINIANGVVPVSGSEGGIINLYLGGTGSVTGNYAATNSLLGRITFSGYGNNFFYQGAEVNAIVSTGGNIDRSDHVADLQFLTKGVGPNVPTERMRITGSGNVGIGTTSPTARLQVNGSSSASEFALKINDVSNNNLLSVQNNGDVTLKNPLSVANGGTGSTTQNFVDLTTTQSIGGAKTFTSAVTATTFNPTSSTATGTGMFAPTSTSLGFSTNGTNRVTINSSGNIGVGTTPLTGGGAAKWITLDGIDDTAYGGGLLSSVNGITKAAYYYESGFGLFQGVVGVGVKFLTSNIMALTVDTFQRVGIGIIQPTEKLHVVGNARITAMNGINDIGASATGVLQAATSDMNLKNTIEDSPFGLNEILLLKPVTFLYNDENRKIDSDVKEVGFIAQDVFDIIPNAVSSTGTGDLQLDYRAITAALVKAIQEQQALIKALEQRILNLENK